MTFCNIAVRHCRGFQLGDFALGGLEQILQQLTEHYQPVFQRTARRTLESLPKLRVPTEQQQQQSAASAAAEHEADKHGLAACRAGEACTVCHDEFLAGAEVVQLPCRHCFHDTCIHPWLEGHNTCPVCRTVLPAEPSGSGGPPAGQGETQGPPGGAGEALPGGGLAALMDQLVGSFMAAGAGAGTAPPPATGSGIGRQMPATSKP